MEFAAEPNARRAARELWETAASEGVVAMVTMASGETLTPGYSERFGNEYPLRIVKKESASGLGPGDFPVIRVTLESIY
jgi:hypothetical protein